MENMSLLQSSASMSMVVITFPYDKAFFTCTPDQEVRATQSHTNENGLSDLTSFREHKLWAMKPSEQKSRNRNWTKGQKPPFEVLELCYSWHSVFTHPDKKYDNPVLCHGKEMFPCMFCIQWRTLMHVQETTAQCSRPHHWKMAVHISAESDTISVIVPHSKFNPELIRVRGHIMGTFSCCFFIWRSVEKMLYWNKLKSKKLLEFWDKVIENEITES